MAITWDEDVTPKKANAAAITWDDDVQVEDTRPPFLERSIARLKQGGADAASTMAGFDASMAQSGERHAHRKYDAGMVSTAPPPITTPRLPNPDTVLRQAIGGDLIPAAADVAGDAFITAGKAVLPESVQRGITSAARYVGDSTPVQYIAEGLRSWEEKDPDTFNEAKNSANILSLFSPRIPLSTSIGTSARTRHTNSAARQRKKGFETMLRPTDVVNASGKTTEKGLLRSKVYDATDYEKRMYAEVNAVAKADPERSHLFNMNAMEDEVGKVRRNLDANLATADPISVPSVMNDVDSAVRGVDNNPALVGDAGVAAQRIYGKFADIVEKYASPSGFIDPVDLLQARRDLDFWLKSSSGSIFDSTTSARAIAVKQLRQQINARVAEAAPSAEVLQSLQKQSDLLSARDIFAERAAKEGDNLLARGVQRVEDATGLMPTRTPQSTAANLSSIPAMGVTGVATLGVLGTRALNKATRATAVATLEGIEKVVNSGGKITAKMQADRAAALSLLNQDEQKEQE
jgi:hypothetical protein